MNCDRYLSLILLIYLPIRFISSNLSKKKSLDRKRRKKKKIILKIGIIIELLYFLTGMCEINEWVSGSDCGSVV